MPPSFSSFSQALDEVKNIRVFAGIHFGSACDDGQATGTGYSTMPCSGPNEVSHEARKAYTISSILASLSGNNFGGIKRLGLHLLIILSSPARHGRRGSNLRSKRGSRANETKHDVGI